jgi:hypothetical protein
MIPAPEQLTSRLARRAVEIAQITGPRKTGKALNSLIPISQIGMVGIDMPDETAYLLDLDRGIQAHTMVDLAGRVIPMRDSDGSLKFRRATSKTVGQIPIITRLSKSGKIYTGKPQWVYPSTQGSHFLEKAIQRSINEWTTKASTKEIIDMLMLTDVKETISEIVYGRRMV